MRSSILQAVLVLATLAAILWFSGNRGPIRMWGYDGNPDDERGLCLGHGKQWHARADGRCYAADEPGAKVLFYGEGTGHVCADTPGAPKRPCLTDDAPR